MGSRVLSNTFLEPWRQVRHFLWFAQPSPCTPPTTHTHLRIEPVSHRRALEPVQVLRVEDRAPLGFAHEMQQPKVDLMFTHTRAKARDQKSNHHSTPLRGRFHPFGTPITRAYISTQAAAQHFLGSKKIQRHTNRHHQRADGSGTGTRLRA